MHPWDWPEHPWQCIHLDCAGPINDKMFLIVVDTHPKWMEVEIVHSATSQATTEGPRMIFARFGLPEVMVTNNEHFCYNCYIKTARFVQTIIWVHHIMPLVIY